MGVKKFQSIFIRFVSTLAFGIIVIVAINIFLYSLCVSSGFILSSSRIHSEVDISKKKIQTQQIISIDLIPDFCEYALFSKDGNFQEGTVTQQIADTWWTECMINHQTNAGNFTFNYVECPNQIAILRYRSTAQFQNKTLRMLFPVADFVLIGLVLLELIAFLFILSNFFGKSITRKMKSLHTALQKIEQQDLDFEEKRTQIYEIDQTLDAIDHMKTALKLSITKQCQEDQIKQEQLSALAHDLKTPLTIIRGNAELLLFTDLNEEQKECVDYIESSSTQMQEYIQNLISITKSWDSYQLHLQDTSLEQLLHHIEEQINGLVSVKQVKLFFTFRQTIPSIQIDYDLFTRAIINILSNAIEHTPQNGKVFFDVWDENEQVFFMIHDSGPGFTPEALKHATEQFFMDDASRNSKIHYGIGLYIASSTIEKHGGKLTLENDDQTGGAKVTIQIPCT